MFFCESIFVKWCMLWIAVSNACIDIVETSYVTSKMLVFYLCFIAVNAEHGQSVCIRWHRHWGQSWLLALQGMYKYWNI